MIIGKLTLTQEEQDEIINSKSLEIDFTPYQVRAKQRYILSFGKDVNITYESVNEGEPPILKLSDSDSEKVRQAILSDVKEILQAVTKSDFESGIEVGVYDCEPNFDNALKFLIVDVLDVQISAYDYYRLNVDEITDFAEQKATEWYGKDDYYITIGEQEKKTKSDREKVKKSYVEIAKKDNQKYLMTKQTKAINEYPSRAKEGINMTSDYLGNAIITDKDYTCNILGYSQLADLRPSTKQALFWLVSQVTSFGTKSLEGSVTLDDYMTIRGLKDKRKSRIRVEEDMKLILNSNISYDREIKRKDKDGNLKITKSRVGGFNLLQDWHWTDRKRNKVVFKLTETFFTILKRSTVMPLPTLYYRINSQNNPASCDFLLKIALHKNYNIDDLNENIISVVTLLNSTRAIPTKEMVDDLDRNTAKRIIEPFERDMNALQEVFDWHYCHPQSRGKELTDEELESLDFYTFSRLMIKIDWKDYPDQTKRLERQAERIAENKEKQKQKAEKQKKTRTRKKTEN